MLGAGSAGAATLISNGGQTLSGVAHTLSSYDAAQAFTTGNNPITLTGVEVQFNPAPGSTASVTAFIATGRTSTDTIVATLTNPATWSATSTFGVPSGTSLSANTTYHLFIIGDDGKLALTGTGDEDSGGASGWSIGNTRYLRTHGDETGLGGTFLTSGTVFKFAIEGTEEEVDNTAPTLSSAETSSLDQVLLTYDEALDSTSIPDKAQFEVEVGGAARTVTTVEASGTMGIALQLGSPNLTHTDTVTVSYAVPTLNPIQDEAGNDAAALSGQAVTNLITAPPMITSVAITSDPGTDNTYIIGDDIVVTLTFDKNITLSGTGVDPLISLNIGTEELNPSCTVGTPPTMDLVCTQTVEENWEDSDGVDVGGNSLSELGKRIVGPLEQRADTTHSGLPADSDHKVDGVKPTLVSAAASSDLTKVVLTFSEALTETPAPAAGDFTLDVDSGTAPTIDSVAVDGSDVTLSLSAAVDTSNAYTIDYTAGTNPIEDVPGNAAEDISGQSVGTVDDTAPTFVSANIPANNAHWIVLTYSETLDSTSIPAKSAFTVEVEGNDRTPTAVAGDASGTVIILGVDPAIRPGETVTVSYTKPGTNPIKDAADNEAASLAETTVVNNLAATAPEAPGNLAAASEAVPGTPSRAYADRMVLSWDTPWNNGDAITSYKVRYVEGSSAGGTLAAIAGSGASTTSHTVTGLEPGTEYTFGIVAVNGQGDGDEATVTMTTPAPAWSFTLRDSSNTNVTELTEGGDSATATVSITNNVRFGTDQTVTLKWGLDLSTGLIRGAGNATTITIGDGESSGSLEINAIQIATDSYDPPYTTDLVATLGGTEIASIELTRVDAQNPPVATITEVSSSVNEGENIEVEITLAPPLSSTTGAHHRIVKFTVSDADSALSGTVPTSTSFSPNQGSKTVTLTAADNSTMNDGGRDITFTLALNPDAPYTLGTPSSATVTVRDDDTPPLAPENLRAQAGNTEAILRWDAPLASTPDHGQPVLHYESRVQAGTAAFGSWTTIPNSDATTGSHTFTGLTNGTEYTYEVRAENVAGDGAEAQVAVTPVVGVAVSFGAATLSVDEGGTGQATLTLATAPAAGATATVPITATPGEGLGTGEYSGVPASVTFAAGETSKSFTVAAVQDTLDEPDEVLTLSLGALPAGYVPGTTPELAITVVDDDVALLGLALRDSGGNDVTQLVEGGSSATAEVSITNSVRFSTDQTVTLEWGGAEISGGLIQGAGGSATFTIAAEQASGSLTISAPQDPDSRYRLPETKTLTANLGGNQIGAGIELEFVDDESVPVLTIGLSKTRVTEGEAVMVTANISGGYTKGQLIAVANMTGDTAKLDPGDYDSANSETDVVFLPGDTSSQKVIDALDNTIPGDHGEVVFTVPTDNPLFTPGSPSSVTLTILDNDAAPTAPRNFRAQARDGAVVLTWDPPTSLATTEFTAYELRHVAGGSPGGTFADISADPETTTHTVTGLTNETEYTFELRAKNSFGSSGPVGVSKTPRAGVAVSFGAAAASVDEGGSVSVSLTLGEAPTSSVTVPISAAPGAGLDANEYSGVPSSVTFDAGQTSGSFTVATVDDADDEPDRTLTLSLGTLPDGYAPGANEELILTIADNDVPIVSASFGAAAASVAEGVPFDVTVSLSQAPEREVALPISAARGANLAADEVDGVPSSLTFAADETSKSFAVTFADDAAMEGNETLTLTFGTLPFRVNSAGAHPRLVLTATDDDGPPAAPDVTVRTGDGYAALSWAAVANDSPVLRYEVRWKEEGGAFAAWVSAGTETSYRAEGLTNDTPHEFEVRGVNAHGEGEGGSVPATPTARLTGTPKAPQWLRVNATDSSRAELKWGRPSNGTDKVTANSATAGFSQIQGYRIEVCRTACGGADAEWHAAVANTGEFKHAHTHQVLAPGVIRENRYRVQAININGKTGPYSNTATLEATRLERFWLVSPNSSTVDVHLEVWHPDGNPLYVRYQDTSDPMSVRYAEQRLTKRGYPVIGLPVEASTHYKVEVDFADTFDSPRLRSAKVWSLREGADPYTSPYAVDALDAQVHRGGSWREAPDTQLTVRMGESGRYRVRLKPCAGERTVIARRIEAPAGALRASPMEVDPFPLTLRCGGDDPGAWKEVTVTALALEDYDADMRAEALLRTPFAVVYNHEVWRDTGATTSTLVSEGTGLVRAAVARPAGATLATPAGVAIADPAEGSSGPLMSWNAVGGASEYLVNWRYGPRYSSGANADRSRQADTGVAIPFGASRRGPITARVRAFSSGGVSDWSAERTWDSRPPTLSVLDTAVNEDDGAVGFLVKLDPAASGTVTVGYATSDATAVAPADYAAASGTLTFAPGEREKKTPLVAIVDDDEEDSGETFRLVLSNPTGGDADNGAAVLGDAEAVATILNSERAAARLTGFTLVDAGANADLMALADGATVALGDLMASSYGIRANLGPGAAPGSVRIELAGAKTVARTDDAAPYSLHGDGGGRINGASLPAGSYTLTATAYADSGGRGDELGSLTVSFAAAAGALATTTPGPFEVAEGETAVAALAATETGTGETATWSIPEGTAGGADGEAFALTAGGALSLAAAKDFEAPDDADGDGAYAVTVEMAAGEQTATVDLLVTLTNVNEAPAAKASATPHKVREGVEVTLDGSASADPDADDTLSHAWTQTEDGPRVTLSDAAAARTTFTSPSDLEAETELTFALRATDAGGLHAEDTATVTVTLVSEVSIAAAADYPAEGADAVFRLTRAGSAFHALTVPATVSETGAMLGEAPESATFAAGARETELRVPTAADTDAENDSVVTAELAAGAGWALAAGATAASVTVLDDDAAPVGSTAAADVTVWSADMRVVEYGAGSIGAGSADLFSNQQGRAGLRAKWLWWDPGARALKIGFDDSLDDAGSLTLHVGDLSVGFPENSGGDSSFRIENVDVSWTDGETLAARVSKPSAETLSTDATLKSLTVSDAELVPEFDAQTLVYRAAVAADTATVAATAADAGAAVAYGTAEDADAESDGYQAAVPDAGEALVEVAVTAADGTVRRYRAVLSRAAAEAAENTAPTGLPEIAGTAEVGATLTASADDVEDGDGLDNATFAYQWLADDAAIAGATGTTYEAGRGDVGKTLKVRVTFTDDGGTAETLDSAATEAVVDNRPTVTSVAMAEPPAGGWTDGDAVRLSVGFSAAVTVSTGGGTPSVALSLDGTARQASYASGTGTTSLTFSYAVEADDATVSTVSAAANSLATNGGAIRDADGRDANLAHDGFEITAEAEEPETVSPLTASFSDVPATHDGSSEFTFQVEFSEDVGIGYATMRDDAFEVDEGDVNGARWVNGRHDLWEITVEPDGREAVSIALPGERACGETGAVCTRGEDPRPLSNSPSATVAGPAAAVTPTVGIADAGGTEGDGDIAFAVTLDSAGTDAVTVDYATSNGTADDDDYTATSGTLTFAAGTTSGTITVPIADDDVNEGDETFTVALSNASGAALGTAGATGTIRNRHVAPTASISGGGGKEGDDDAIAFAVTLDRAAAAAVTVDYATSDGSATAGEDYTATGGTLSFAAGETGKTVSVPIGDDIVNESDETFTVALSNASGAALGTASATGTIENRHVVPLTASFEQVPAEHDGTTFAFHVRFSEDPAVSYLVLRDESFGVTGGEVDKARRKDGRDDLREIHVEPSGNGDVTVSLPPTTDCDADGAICTADDRPLSNANAATVRAMAALSAADAETTEGAGATLEFAVTLSRAAAGTVTVGYATSDGTAVAGTDYTSASGTLTFDPGETAGTVSVAVLDDSVDDDGETLTLRLSNASGARIADATATGTINNADPVPLAWLARFGRAASDHAVEAIGARFEDDGGGAHATFAGRRLWGGGAAAVGEDAFGADPWAGAAGDDAFGFGGNGFGGNAPGGMNPAMNGGMGMNGGPQGGIGMNPGTNGGAALGPAGAGGYRPALRDLLIGSSFLLSADGADEAGASRRLTAWGRAAATRFDGVADGVSVDGEVATFLVGADAAWNRWLAGISVAHTIGAGGFRGADGADGELDSALTAVHPYLRYRLSDRISAWGVLGYGSGDLTLETDGSAWETDTSMRMAAAGMRGVLLRGAGGLELAAKTDVRLTRIASDAAEGAAGLLGATAGAASRARLLLEGSRPFSFGPMRTLTPTLEVGVRRDGGDAETGMGVDLGGSLRYADAALGLTAEAGGRYLAAHEDAGYREWGASASIRIDPGVAGRGLTLSVAPSWGADAAGGAERLWSARDARGLAGHGFDAAMRLRAEVGYGLPAFRGRGGVTPFAGVSTTAFGRDWRAGALWRRGPALEMALEATRGESAGERPAHGVLFRLTWRPGAREEFRGADMDAPCPAGGTTRGGGESGIGSAPACAREPETRRAAPRGD